MFTGIIEEKGVVTSLTSTGRGSAILALRADAVLDGLPEGGSLAVNGVCLTQAGVDQAGGPGPVAPPTDGTTPASPRTGTSGTGAPIAAPATGAREFRAHVMGETLTRTTVGRLSPGDEVNLERCPRAGDRFDGHVVQGHVDGTGTVLDRVDEGDWVRLRVSVPGRLAPFTAEKGSIALDGISLTLTAVSPAAVLSAPATPSAPSVSSDPGPSSGLTAVSPSAQASSPPTAPPSSPGTGHWVEVGLIPATLAATRMGAIAIGDEVNIEVDVMAKYAARLAEFGAPTEGASA